MICLQHAKILRELTPPIFKVLGCFNLVMILCSMAGQTGLLIQPHWTILLSSILWRLSSVTYTAPCIPIGMSLSNKPQLIGAFFYCNVWSQPDNIFKLPATVPISWYNDWLLKTATLKLVKVPFKKNSLLASPYQSLLFTSDGAGGAGRKVTEISFKPVLQSWICFNAFVLN